MNDFLSYLINEDLLKITVKQDNSVHNIFKLNKDVETLNPLPY